jgi:DNA polymerase-3 subunit delta'
MNWDILGHEWAVGLLQAQAAHGYLRHAYLITGPQGIGRRTLALRLAQTVNCLQPPAPGEPCLACRACTQLARMQHPDLDIVQAEQVGGTLRVEQVRQLQHNLSLAPYEARYRVALLLRFEEAHPSAANALLKTLEEPPSQVLLLLTAESAEGLLPTIVSRCEVLRLRPASLETVYQGLQSQWGLPDEEARLLAHLSGGRVGRAVFLHEHPEALEQRKAWLDDHRRLLSATRFDRFNYAEAHSRDKETLRLVLQTWASLWRDVLLRAGGAAAPLINLDRVEDVETLAEREGLSCARRMVQELERTVELLEDNINPRLATEVLLLDLPRL